VNGEVDPKSRKTTNVTVTQKIKSATNFESNLSIVDN
jgi:hypothetical protein